MKKAVDLLTKDTREDREWTEYRAEYKGDRNRRALSVDKWEYKFVDIYSKTETETVNDGNEVPKKTRNKPIFVAKAMTNIPKRIVRIATAFLFGGEMNISFAEDNGVSQFPKKLVFYYSF